MIVEIGTSDFRTLAGIEDGLFIEPVKPYFDRLPDCRKENIAISNRVGEIQIFYVEPEAIEELGLPNWARGCNSVNKPHPTIEKLLFNKSGVLGKDYIKSSVVKVDRIANVLRRHKIDKFRELKIDTEGHDTIILNDYLDTVDFRPSVIKFEDNGLTHRSEIQKIVRRLQNSGYKVRKIGTDMIAQK